jgi:phage-related protein
MVNIISSTWQLVTSLLGSLLSIGVSCAVWVWDVIYHLHVSAPRLEGFLVGVALVWIMLRRDKHPALRVLSAPLKVVIDILDLVWDQLVDFLKDSWETVKSVISSCKNAVLKVVSGAYSAILGNLVKLKERLKKSS